MNLFCLIPGFCIRVVDIRPPSNGGVVCVCVWQSAPTALSLPFHCPSTATHCHFTVLFTTLSLPFSCGAPIRSHSSPCPGVVDSRQLKWRPPWITAQVITDRHNAKWKSDSPLPKPAHR